MELKTKEEVFRKLQQQIRNNSKSIVGFKKWSPVLMFLFVVNAFAMFYFSVIKAQGGLQHIVVSIMVVLFLVLTIFQIFISKKEKENKIIDAEICKLLSI